jgi:16S rRNA (guanine527-N7)-methyltransferase
MKIGSREWIRILLEGAEKMQLHMGRNQANRFVDYARMLLEWNQKINLTSITEPREIAIKHFLDSLAPSACIPTQGSLLDIGTGGGFPGVPLKILRTRQPMVLIDGARKKINFIKQVIRDLNLSDIEALQLRAEDFNRANKVPERFDVVVSRAVTDVDAIVQLAAPLLKPEGRIIVYKGPNEKPLNRKEMSVPQSDIRFVRSSHTYNLPHSGDRRTAIILEVVSKPSPP